MSNVTFEEVVEAASNFYGEELHSVQYCVSGRIVLLDDENRPFEDFHNLENFKIFLSNQIGAPSPDQRIRNFNSDNRAFREASFLKNDAPKGE